MSIIGFHPNIVSILKENKGRMDRLELAYALAPRGFRIDEAYAEIGSAVNDGTVIERRSGLTTTIYLNLPPA